MGPGARHLRRNLDEPGERTRRPHHGEPRGAAKGVLAIERDDKVQALVDDARKRMGWIEPDGREHRQQFLVKVLTQPSVLRRVGGPVHPSNKANVLLLQCRDEHRIEGSVLLGNESMGAFTDLPQQGCGQDVVRPRLDCTHLGHLLETCHTHLVELVEIGAGNAKKLHAFDQRNTVVLGLFEHALVELQQREPAVDVVVWLVAIRGGRRVVGHEVSLARVSNVLHCMRQSACVWQGCIQRMSLRLLYDSPMKNACHGPVKSNRQAARQFRRTP